MTTLIINARIVNEGHIALGSILIEGDTIAEIYLDTKQSDVSADRVIDASGCYVMPGVIDTHVHFREPGLTTKADIRTESRAAAAGGVTSFFDMPNTLPQTTTLEALDEKFRLAAQSSMVNYSFFFGATNDNVDLIALLDPARVPGVKLFMGSSTGNMLVDQDESLRRLFASTSLPIMAHCEDTSIINRNAAEIKEKYGAEAPVDYHPVIRSAEACYASTARAVALAKEYGAQLHVAHVSTERELELFGSEPTITAEACTAYLHFSQDDYKTLGSLIKVNPAIKTSADRDALRRALNDGRIATIATDHAPHRLEEKQGGCLTATSGMPMVQFSLPLMLELVDEGVLSIERMVELMCHNPALLFQVRSRGFIRKGYKADLVVVRPDAPTLVDHSAIESKCAWSPLLGADGISGQRTFRWSIIETICNGQSVYRKSEDCREHRFSDTPAGQALEFR